MAKPLFSICVPTYNRANFLRRLLENVGRQIPADGSVEIVVSDNGSTDETKAVIEQAQKQIPALHWGRSEVNLGQAANYKRVLELAEGTFCLWMGDDDILADGAVDYYVRLMRENQHCDWFVLNFITVPQEEIDELAKTRRVTNTQPGFGNRLPAARYGRFETWEAVLETPHGVDLEFFFAIFGCAFRRELGIAGLSKLCMERTALPKDLKQGPQYTKEAYYPQTLCWIEALRGRPGALLPEAYYLQGIGHTRGDDAGQISFGDVIMPNLWMWVYPQVYRHLRSHCQFRGAQKRQVLRRLALPCLKQIQDRGLKKKPMFASWTQGVTYFFSIRTFLLHCPFEAARVFKNLLPSGCIDGITQLKSTLLRRKRAATPTTPQ